MARCARRLARRCVRFQTGPAACQTDRLYIASVNGLRRAWRTAQWLARCISADASIQDGPGVLPDGSLVAFRRMVGSRQSWRLARWLARISSGRDGPSVLPDCSLVCRFGGSFGRDGPGVLPDGSLASVRRMIRLRRVGVLPDGSRASVRGSALRLLVFGVPFCVRSSSHTKTELHGRSTHPSAGAR